MGHLCGWSVENLDKRQGKGKVIYKEREKEGMRKKHCRAGTRKIKGRTLCTSGRQQTEIRM